MRELAGVLRVIAIALAAPAAASALASGPSAAPAIGFTVHWDFATGPSDVERLVAFAIDHGARVLNVVPPPHIWEQPESLAALRSVFTVARQRGVGILLNRIDGSSFAVAGRPRINWLYAHVLTERGRLPDGMPTPDVFLATVGNPAYERWLEEETRFYAAEFSGEPALLAFSVGLFNEPFVSQRGGLLCYSAATDSYELAQYTPEAAAIWRRWLTRAYGGVRGVNRIYGTDFRHLAALPMPVNEADPRFGDAGRAFFDLLESVNDWVVERYERCRRLWHERARREVPFLLQFSGYVPEKFEKGRPAFAALDIFDWMARADALGLSLYTNCDYPDWGQASDRAMVGFLALGRLLGKQVYVLEGGNECDGAVLDPAQLAFFASAARSLAPDAVIYEFLRTTYYESSARRAGKILDDRWAVNRPTLAAVDAALKLAVEPVAAPAPMYVLDDPGAIAGVAGALAQRRELIRMAMRQSVVCVPRSALDRLPSGASIVVVGRASEALSRRLSGLGLRLVAADSLPVFGTAGVSPRDRDEGGRP